MKKMFIFLLLLSAGIVQAQCLSGNCENGTGVALVSKDVIYTGSFKNSLPDGVGDFRNADLVIYSGEVRMGHYNGKGTQYLDNGDVYIGEFLNGMRHGPGEYRSKSGIENRKYFYNRSTGRDPYGNVNNALYTGYNATNNVVLSNDKVAVFAADGNNGKADVYSATTGQKLETAVSLNSIFSHSGTALYLDFGTRFYDTAKSMLKLYTTSGRFKNQGLTYLGKSVSGEAVFEEFNSNAEVHKIFTIADPADKPQYIYKYKGGQYHVVDALSKDLSKAVISELIVNLKDEKATPVMLKGIESLYNKFAVFTNSGDSLFVNDGGKTLIYSSQTGEMIVEVEKLKNFYSKDFSASYNPYKLIRILQDNGTLVLIENAFNKQDVMPLIDNNRSWYAAEVYIGKENAIREERQAFEEREHLAYAKKMEAIYGKNWNVNTNINSNKSTYTPGTSKSGAPNEVKCSFCNGSGVTANYVTGQEITQDKTSGRWYHQYLDKTGTCPLCNGTGYLKR